MFRLLILSFGLCEGQLQSQAVPPILARLPDFIHEFCPGVNICSTNKSITAAAENSCCTECSCEAECTMHGDCCFPKAPQSNPLVNTSFQDFQIGRSCLFPMLPKPTGKQRTWHQSYSMISSVAKETFDSSNSSCGDTNVAPWGSLYPVYSDRSKQIYKNMHCAQANGITDGVRWDVLINCDSHNAIDAVIALESNEIHENCKIRFLYSGKSDDLKRLQCNFPLFATCPESLAFQIPEGTSLSKNDIVSLCTSGLVSPFRAVKMYANVFCHICNGELYPNIVFCHKQLEEELQKSAISKGFTALIDGRFIDELNDNIIVEEEAIPKACFLDNTTTCRQILCPSGQIRNKEGRCVFINKVWYNQNVCVNINLTSNKSINATEMFNVSIGARAQMFPPLKSPWRQTWSILDIFYRETGTNEISNNFIVRIGTHSTQVNPSRIIQYIKKMTKKPWSFDLNNMTVVLKSSFTEFISPLIEIDYSKISLSKNLTANLVKPRYIYFHEDYRSVTLNNLMITNMYVCEQVELVQSEFTLSLDGNVLYNYITRRFLFDGQFVIIKIYGFGENRARICIEDSGLQIFDTVTNVGTIVCMFDNCIAASVGLLLEVLYIKYQM